ncbi:unnamed protein product [Blepharisma stoltei]|uniref:Telomeric single stranded DNA binding POT1/Cdc13 domain-containing protein n=1 Tax=Blepharisma stoltei TaxID=1481888 RepID=A0AAU9JQ76_9CILI|nr:unnamed protein product [Blepharisma stoltei]
MFVRSIQENERESRIFRAEVKDNVELCAGVSRLLLMDITGDFIYCLLEGDGWCQKARLLMKGDKVVIGPCKIAAVPERYRAFYSPVIPDKFTSPFYVHYSSTDLDLKLEIERMNFGPKINYTTRSLQECQQLALANSLSKVSIIGVIIDYVAEIKMPKDNICKLKIIDQSLSPGDFIQLHVFVETTLKQINIGDIVVAHGITFKHFRGKAQGTHNNKSGPLAIYSASDNETLKITSHIGHFQEDEDLYQNVVNLYDWETSQLSSRDLSTGPTLPSLGEAPHYRYKTLDLICYVAHKKQDYPDPSQSTLVLCDSSGYLFLTTLSCLLVNINEDKWVKIREAKISSDQIQFGDHSSIVVVPDWCYNVKMHMQNTIPGLETIRNEALNYLYKTINQASINQQIIVTRTRKSSVPLFDESQLLNPLEKTEFCRLKVIIIQVQPKNIEDGVFEMNDGLNFYGIINIWCLNDIIEVSVAGENSIDLFGLHGIKNRRDFINKIDEVTRLLVKGNNWVELCLKRKVVGNKVILKVVNTFLT